MNDKNRSKHYGLAPSHDDSESPEKKKAASTRANHKVKPLLILSLLSILLAAITVIFYFNAREAGISALKENYRSAFVSEKDDTYQDWYNRYFEQAQADYSVANKVSISIGGLKEVGKLEVLSVSDVEYIIEDSSDNDYNITSWLEVPGHGTYTVDLQAAEFIVDNERQFVRVRVPYPELSNITIDYSNVKKLFFRNDLLNDSFKAGEELGEKQTNAADLLIRKELASNQHFYLTAQNVAVTSIKCLVRRFNPGIPDLSVEVEFY